MNAKSQCCSGQYIAILCCKLCYDICLPVLLSGLCCTIICCTICCNCTLLQCVVLWCRLCCAAFCCIVLCCVVRCCAGAVLCYAEVYWAATLFSALQCYAVLECGVPCWGVLCCARVWCAMLFCTVLCCSVLHHAVQCCADLFWAVLRSGVLYCTVQCWGVLCYAVLYYAVQCWADRDELQYRSKVSYHLLARRENPNRSKILLHKVGEVISSFFSISASMKFIISTVAFSNGRPGFGSFSKDCLAANLFKNRRTLKRLILKSSSAKSLTISEMFLPFSRSRTIFSFW